MSKKVEIYTWRICPYCVKAKQLLESEEIEYIEYDIQGDREKLAELKEETGSGSVPQVFVDGEFHGGCDEIHALHADGSFDGIFK